MVTGFVCINTVTIVLSNNKKKITVQIIIITQIFNLNLQTLEG